MMDMKKGVVNETVKENRADELSAMFNMMIDNRKRIMGKCYVYNTSVSASVSDADMLVNKPVGDWISAPSPNVVDPQTMTHRL